MPFKKFKSLYSITLLVLLFNVNESSSRRLVISRSDFSKCKLRCRISLRVDMKCASNGVSYQNMDEINCAKSRCFPELKVLHDGECTKSESEKILINQVQSLKSSNISLEDTKSQNKSVVKKPSTPKIPLIIPFEIQSNRTEKLTPKPNLENKKKRVKQIVKEPEALTKNENVLESEDFEKRSECDDCVCDYMLKPVCGTNLITYGNSCILDCKKPCEKSLEFYHDGFCGKIFFRDDFLKNITFFSQFSSRGGFVFDEK